MMRRRHFLQNSSLAASAIALPGWAKLLNISAYEMIIMRRNVGIFIDKGGTIGFLLQPDGNVVVDSQWKDQAQVLINEIKKTRLAPCLS